jgi:CheY-like chemotaxis protein
VQAVVVLVDADAAQEVGRIPRHLDRDLALRQAAADQGVEPREAAELPGGDELDRRMLTIVYRRALRSQGVVAPHRKKTATQRQQLDFEAFFVLAQRLRQRDCKYSYVLALHRPFGLSYWPLSRRARRMYTQVIELADATLAANRRVRAEAEALCAQASSLLLQYRAHRFPHLRGASDADAAAMQVRSKVGSGMLPLPTEPPPKSWAGKGTGRVCDGCEKVITSEQVEYELDLANGRALRLHADCLAIWHTTRPEQAAESAQLLAGLRIIVVDDHADSRDLLQLAFTFLGADVTTAATAEEAMRSIATADVVVTDFSLKGKDGSWLLAQVNASVRPIPVVLLSGFVETQAMTDAPFALKLLKPVEPMDLAKKIRAILVR